MTSDEVGRFLSAVEGTRVSAIFAFALATGMRPQEYLALKWADIDMKKGTASVCRALVWRQEKGGGWYFSEPKTSRSRRTMPLPSSMVRVLADHKRKQSAKRLRLGSEWQDHGLVFPTTIGTPFNISSLTNKYFKPATAELPPTYRLYDLRHTHATMLLSEGVNPKVVAERLGHSTIVLTLDTYSHVLPDMQKQAADCIESLLFRRVGTL
jgi:integrase